MSAGEDVGRRYSDEEFALILRKFPKERDLIVRRGTRQQGPHSAGGPAL